MQKNIPIFREVLAPVDLDARLVSEQPNYQRAIVLCMRESRVKGRTNQDWADLLGCSRGYVNQVINSEGRDKQYCFNMDQLHTLQIEAGNWGVYQWLEMRKNGQLRCQSSQSKKQQLLAELAQIEEQERLAV